MRLTVRVIPRSSRNEIFEMPDGALKIRITDPPVEGAANKKLVELISAKYHVAKNRVRIVCGARGRNKIIEINV